ncbi:NUDIX hydrolase [Micromonospora sp. KC207]|uniref:NUDIX domain-containing protein n=1 Tax=Micromonospora sp. KC207 TaxID=2530377 RepID=UPI001045C725|nr:NUDIX hydrolase [Micromonospora sp. KC207]TDC61124.1 NUDIX hydrolase [Micromonospora sp. KC207]
MEILLATNVHELVEDSFVFRRVPDFGLPDDDYARTLDNLVQANVDVIVHTRDGRVLLGYRKDLPLRDMFWVFGGRMKVGETLVNAAARALKRELGLDIGQKPVVLNHIYNVMWGSRSVAPEKRGFQTLLSLMTYECTDDEARSLAAADKTHEWVRWYSRAELHEMEARRSVHLHPFLPIILRNAGLF